MVTRTLLVVAMTLFAAACDGDDVSDAGVDSGVAPDAEADGGAGGIAAPMAPAMAAEPQLTCPEGWSEGGAGELPCLPFAGGLPSCGPSEVALPGAGCTRVGGVCPSGDFPDDLPPGMPTVYVLSGAPAGGDGTLGAPFATVAEGVGAASSGTIVAIGKGAYPEVVGIGPGITLWGACAEETRITSTAFDLSNGTLRVAGSGVVVRNLSVGGNSPGVTVRGRHTCEISDVIVDDAEFVGVLISEGAMVTLEDVIVRGTRRVSEGRLLGRFGRGIEVDDSSVTLRRGLIDSNHSEGLVVGSAGGNFVVEDTLVRDTQPAGAAAEDGNGAVAQLGGTMSLTRVVIAGNAESGVSAFGAGTALAATDVVVTDTRGLASGGAGSGIRTVDGPDVALTRVGVEGSHQVGVFALSGSVVRAEDLVVARTEKDGGGFFGRGLNVDGATFEGTRVRIEDSFDLGLMVVSGATVAIDDLTIVDTLPAGGLDPLGRAVEVEAGGRLTANRVRIERCHDVAVFIKDVGSSAQVADLSIVEVAGRIQDGGTGRGVNVQEGATGVFERVSIDDVGEIGIFLIHPDTTATFSDVRMGGIRGTEAGASGRGIAVQSGAAGDLTRLVIDGFQEIALYASRENASLVVRDVDVANGDGQVFDGLAGRGVSSQFLAEVVVERGRFTTLREAGFFASESGRIVATDVVIADVRERTCAATDCAEAPIGCGIIAVRDGGIQATRFAVAGSSLCGLMVAEAGHIDLVEGVVSGSPIGANVQVPSFDLARIMRDVQYVDNGTNLDVTMLPVPETVTDVVN